MIVELFGLPGAGKSTLARRLEEDGFVRVAARSTSNLLWQNAALFATSPGNFLRRLWAIVRHSPTTWIFRYKVTNLFLHYNAKYRIARGYSRALIDQGHVQGAVSLFERQATEEELAQYLLGVEPPQLLVVLAVPEERMHERIRERSYVVREREGEARFAKRLGVMRANYEAMRALLPRLGWNVVVVDAVLPEDEVYTRVRASLPV